LSRFLLIFIFLFGCSSNVERKNLNEIGEIASGKKNSPQREIEINDRSIPVSNSSKRIVLFLTKETALCISDLLNLDGFDFKVSQLGLLMLRGYLGEENYEWQRYLLAQKYLRQGQDYSGIVERKLKRSIVKKYFIRLPFLKNYISEKEKMLLETDDFTYVLSEVETFNKGNDILVSDININFKNINYIKLGSLNNFKSFKSLKRRCLVITEKLKEALIKEI